ncbi:PDR/VanB family oxidoreductase [Streptomyces spongiae]|uniref:Oxidoreductase n=1 Tax=Streptomyces spongiae TaxID=565072 RepID=A0A5N8X8C1_9ACTN|nr:PDR/VanB family oxidoreductase [Streptomyces spongiae]MPY55721.1 oxidoreductase [Streptomyces spongiae]
MTTLTMTSDVQVTERAERVVRIARKWRAAEGVVALELVDPAGGPLPEWEPGAHIDLIMPDGAARQYSLCGDPDDRHTWRVGVLLEKEGRGGSQWVHQELAEGDLVPTRGPRNHFALEPARRYLFIGGGIGITPILPMVRAARGMGADLTVVYGGRTRESMGFVDELRELHAGVEIVPQSEAGLIDLDRLLANPEPDTLIYCCGPGPLLDAVEQRVARWPAGALRIERFSARTDTELTSDADHAFEVELARSGTVLQVPADQTLLSVLEDAGADVISSCAEGTCGSCETMVLAGDIDHRDSVLSESERAAGDRLMICVSRCRGPKLVLDL